MAVLDLSKRSGQCPVTGAMRGGYIFADFLSTTDIYALQTYFLMCKGDSSLVD